ncbi:MAG: T9SS type A sorting domain-containing protein, partial [Saprospiraceae bacterium]
PTLAEVSCYSDYVNPVAICDAVTVVSLSNNGTAKVYATTIDDGSYDNCHLEELKVRRMTQGWCPYGVADDTQFRSYVEFCCEDVGQTIWVVLRAIDAHGNWNECMAEVIVQDNSYPHITCPPNITISCCYWFSESALHDPHNHTFGTIVGNSGYGQPIVINDPCNTWYSQPHNWGNDGYAGSGGACDGGGNVWVTIPEVIDYRNACGVGIIKRKFYVEYGNWSDWCYQTITVKDYSSNHYSIKWPWDYTADACLYNVDQLDPNDIPPPYDKPTIPGYSSGNSCSLLGIAHEDLVFTFSDGACKKILREWTVIDWCVYQPNNPWSQGIWKHTQVIKLMNANPPQWAYGCPEHVVVDGYEPYCQGRYIDHPHVQDDCTPPEHMKWDYKIDLNNDGSYNIWYEGSGVPYVDKVLPLGWHKILWNVGDACGNYSTCSYKIHVIDKKAPSPICYYGLSSVVMPLGGMVTIWAKDFNASSYDNCTPAYKLKYSFSANPWEASRTFTCDDLGTNPVQIWVHDEYGNKDYCTTFIKINDNSTFCEDMNTVQGLVTTFAEIKVPEVSASMFKIMTDGSLEDDESKDKSNAEGQFALGFGTTQFDRMVMLAREGKPLEGISTLDFIALQRHINGTQPITEPYKLYAADLDGSGRVGANDLLLLRNALLGAYQLSSYQGNLSWVFFGDPCDPSSMEDLIDNDLFCHTGVEINHTGTFPAVAQFKAIKMGDVNGDMVNSAWMIKTRTAANYDVAVRFNELNGTHEFIATKDALVFGFQISVAAKNLNLIEGILPVSANNIAVDKQGISRISWGQTDAVNVKKGEILFSIENLEEGFLPQELLVVDDESLFPEIYTENFTNEKLRIVPFEIAQSGDTYESKVTPNPFTETTTLEITIPVGEEFTVTLYDMKGQELSNRKYISYTSKAEVQIGSDIIAIPGLYYYKVKSSIGELSGKFVRQ